MPTELDQNKLLSAMRATMLGSLGISKELYERWSGASLNAVAEGEGDDKEKASKSPDKLKAGKNELVIQGVIVVDEMATIYKMLFGPDFVTSPKDVAAALKKMDGDVLVKIDSYGGHVKAASVICNALNEYAKDKDKKVNAIVTGWAASAATLIMIQADNLEIAEFGEVMIHRSSTCACGDGKDLKKAGNYLLKNDGTYAEAYAAKSGKDKDEMLKLMDAETWFTAKEAVEVGLVDKIADKRASAKGDDEEEKMIATDEEFSKAEQKGFDYLGYMLD